MDGEVELRGIRYAYTDTGGGGPAVLLLHGWPDDRSLWRHQLSALTDRGYRVVALDWPGHGGSDIPTDRRRYAIPELGLDTVAALDALDIERAHLVAHDYGATVSWETAAVHPERFESFCAISVGHSVEIVRDILRGHVLHYTWLVLHGMPWASRAWYLASDARRFRRAFADHPDADVVLARLTGGGDQTFWTIWERANPSHEVLWRQIVRGARRRRLPMPAMGVYGLQDPLMTEGQMRRSGRYVDGPWRHEVLEGGHWLPLKRAEAVNDLLLDWLERLR